MSPPVITTTGWVAIAAYIVGYLPTVIALSRWSAKNADWDEVPRPWLVWAAMVYAFVWPVVAIIAAFLRAGTLLSRWIFRDWDGAA